MQLKESSYQLGFVKGLKKWKEKNDEKKTVSNLLMNQNILVLIMKMIFKMSIMYTFVLTLLFIIDLCLYLLFNNKIML